MNPTATILAVDDDEEVLRGMVRLLKGADYCVLEAHNGRECLDAVLRHKPDLVLLDVVMPDMEGYEVCREIKKNPETRGTFIVLVSGMRTTADDQVKGLDDGADGYISRPFSNREFLARVASLLRLKQREEELRAEIDRRRQSELALRKSEEYLRTTLMSVGDGVIVTDGEGRVVLLNPVAETLTGWRRDEAAGRSLEYIFRIINEETRATVENPVHRVLREGVIVGLANHTVLVARDGTERPIADSAAPIFITDGPVTGVILVFRDQTEERAAQKAVQDQFARLKAILDATPFPVALVDIEDSNIEFWSRSAHTLFGHTAPTTPEWYEMAYPDPDYRQEVINRWKPFLERARLSPGQPVNTGEYRVACQDGSTRICELYATFLADKLIVTFNDITDRTQAERALVESKARYRNLVEGSPDIVYSFSDKRGGIYYSSRVETVLGYSLAELYADPFLWNRSVHPEDLAHISQAVAEFGRGTDFEVEYRIRDKAGNWLWLKDRSIRRRVEEDEVFIDGLASDITVRKRAEEEQAASEERFHRAVVEAPFPIMIHAEDGEVLALSRGWKDITGYDAGDIPTIADWTERAYGACKEEVLADIDALYALDRRKAEGEYTVTCKDGSQRVWDFSSVPLGSLPDGRRTVMSMAADVTERKRAEAEAQSALQYIENIVNAIGDPVFVKDDQCRFVLANDAQCVIAGCARAELIGRTDADFFPPEQADIFGEMDRRVLATGRENINEELVTDTKTGETRTIVTRKTPHTGPGGTRFIVGVSRDITERKRLEESLREAQSILQSAMDHSPAGIAIADAPSGRLRYVNDAGLFIRGGGREAVVDGVGIDEYVARWQILDLDGTPLPTDAVPLARAILHGEVNSREFIVRRVPGDDRIVLANAAPITNAAGKTIAGIVIFLDITDRKRTEAALRESEEMLSEAQSIACLGSYVLDLPSRSWVSSGELDRLLGVDETYERSMEGWAALFYSDDRAMMTDYFRNEVLGRGQRFDKEYRIVRHNDRAVRWMHALGRLELDAEGCPLRMHGTVQDITKRKQAEEEKTRLEAQLHQSQKMESVGRLAGGVAHDFNNMLAVILGYTEVGLGQVAPDDPLHADLGEIQKAAKRSADLTRQLLAFARKQTVSPKVLELNDTVSGMLKMLQRIMGENISLAWHPSPNLWPVNMDPSQVDQMLANLCVNARDAIANVGKVTIETANRTCDEEYCADRAGFMPGDYVTLAVSDDGCGMDQETLAHIFEPFFTTNEMGKGTGLGLATVYGAVKQNNGFIHAYSEPGQGTTFTLYLPRHASEAEQAQAQRSEETSPRGRETILLAEDERAVLKLTAKLLEGLGYTVLVAPTPDEAVRLAQEYDGEIHLLMTDVVMPEMNGRELANLLSSARPRLKHLFMSGYTADVIARHGVLEKGVCFIQKPFSISDLAKRVREALGNEQTVMSPPLSGHDGPLGVESGNT